VKETTGGLEALGEGSGIHLEDGTGLGEGAVMPLPVNWELVREYEAAEAEAGAEEYEEWEWWEEEGEYVSYHPDEGDEQEPHIEPVVLYQPLEEEFRSIRANLVAMCSAELREHDQAKLHGACIEYASLFGEIAKFGGELIHGAKKVARRVIHHALAFIKQHIRTITNIVGGCDKGAIEGGIGGGIGGAIFAPFVGPETVPIGAIGGGAGGCIVGGFEGALGI